jgi:hypothetical protein
LLHLQLQERNEKHLLALLRDAYPSVNDVSFKHQLFLSLLETEQENDRSLRTVVLNCVLNDVEQSKLVLLPVCQQAVAPIVCIPQEENFQLPLLHERQEWEQDLLDVVLNISTLSLIDLELIFAYLHSLDLVLVVVFHDQT